MEQALDWLSRPEDWDLLPLRERREVAEEVHTTSHWWQNRTRKPVVLLSADILHDKDDPHMM